VWRPFAFPEPLPCGSAWGDMNMRGGGAFLCRYISALSMEHARLPRGGSGWRKALRDEGPRNQRRRRAGSISLINIV